MFVQESGLLPGGILCVSFSLITMFLFSYGLSSLNAELHPKTEVGNLHACRKRIPGPTLLAV